MDRRFLNIIILGVCFMLIFTAFQTCSLIQENVLEAARNETLHHGNSSSSVLVRLPPNAGYISLFLIYGVFAATNWLSPSIVTRIGPKAAMFFGAITCVLFIGSFLKPMAWSLFSTSVLFGFGAAVLWTGQGTFLTLNSDSETVGRNSGVFWALLQCSLLFGNLFVFTQFHDESTITMHTRTVVYGVLTVVGLIGTLALLVLRGPEPTALSTNTSEAPSTGSIAVIRASFRLLLTRDMAFLAVVFAYTGLELAFLGAVYATCVGHTHAFPDAKAYIGLVGIAIGVGEILGGSVFGIFGHRITSSWGRDSVILFGFIVHTLTFYLTFINFPADSPLTETSREIYPLLGHPRWQLALFGAFLLGLGDSSYNTQVYSILGRLYPEQSSSAFALFKFIQSLWACIGLIYSTRLTLPWQLLVLQVNNLWAALAFFAVNATSVTTRDGYTTLESDRTSDNEE